MWPVGPAFFFGVPVFFEDPADFLREVGRRLLPALGCENFSRSAATSADVPSIVTFVPLGSTRFAFAKGYPFREEILAAV